MSAIRKFRTIYHSWDDPDWEPLERLSALVRSMPELLPFHPYEFMWMCSVANERKRLVIHLYKHIDTRRYLNLDEAGHAYEYCDDPNRTVDLDDRDFSGHYRLHRSLERAIDRLDLWEFEICRLFRSHPPETWPNDEQWAATNIAPPSGAESLAGSRTTP